MRHDNLWLKQLISIEEDMPYRSVLAANAEPYDDSGGSVGSTLAVEGITVFQLDDGILNFRFFVEDNNEPTARFGLFAAQNAMSRISALSFAHPVTLTGWEDRGIPLFGFVDVESFGEKDASLSEVTVHFIGLPENWAGSDRWSHWDVISEDLVRENNTVIVPIGQGKARALGGFTLQAAGWTARLREVPVGHRTEPHVTHLCSITFDGPQLSGSTAQTFLDDNLTPFLSFVFGQHTPFHQIVGYQNGQVLWVRTAPMRDRSSSTELSNWFLGLRHNPIDLSPLFEHFYHLDSDVKEHWRRIIYQYANSEHIMGTLRDNALAASVSFAALEGLTRSIIGTYRDKHDWLNDDLSLKRGKRIMKAIEIVVKREMLQDSQAFVEASEQIRKIRNATFHIDLTSEIDPVDAYYRWNASQALVEALLLSRMGLSEIPNRTAHGVFNVMGKDMYTDVRKEELHLGQPFIGPA